MMSERTPKTMQRTRVISIWSHQAETSQKMANMLQKICHGCRDWTVSAECSMVTVVTAVSQLSGVVLEVTGISAAEV